MSDRWREKKIACVAHLHGFRIELKTPLEK